MASTPPPLSLSPVLSQPFVPETLAPLPPSQISGWQCHLRSNLTDTWVPALSFLLALYHLRSHILFLCPCFLVPGKEDQVSFQSLDQYPGHKNMEMGALRGWKIFGSRLSYSPVSFNPHCNLRREE